MKRCKWVNLNNKKYIDYHDNEWGKEEHNDRMLFELLILEGFQAGLSWECVLNKREYFREAFDNFDYIKISKYDCKKINELLNNQNIIRNKLKVNAAITNAKVFMKMQSYLKGMNVQIQRGLLCQDIGNINLVMDIIMDI